jgi:Na+/serine symporter
MEEKAMGNLMKKWNELSLVKRIIIGLIIGIILAVTVPDAAQPIVIFGSLFVGALKAVAPMLVFFLVMSAISQHKSGHQTNMKSIIVLYLLGTFFSGACSSCSKFYVPSNINTRCWRC